MEELGRLSVEDFKQIQKHPAVIVLDNVRSMHNVGAIFRTCDAFLVEKLVLCGITATPPHREIQKTALGATESVSWEHFQDTKEAVLALKNEGFTLVMVEQTTQSVQLQNFKPETTQKYAFVFGNEAFGVRDEVVPLGDFSLEIPQFGTKHSLNIAVSVGIVLWHYTQRVIV
jgi:tRNA G18 (ribose-2'-O)-methylase SpoU